MLSMLIHVGLAIAVDMLVTGGEIKLLLPAMLGFLLDLKTPELVELLDGALCASFMSAVLLDCLLYHRTAAFMQGPLLHFLRGMPITSRARSLDASCFRREVRNHQVSHAFMVFVIFFFPRSKQRTKPVQDDRHSGAEGLYKAE